VRYNVIRYTKEGKSYRDSDNCDIHVFDVDKGNEHWAQETIGTEVLGWAFSPDGHTLATGHTRIKHTGEGQDQHRKCIGSWRFWDARSGREKEPLSGGPYQSIWSVTYSPDGRCLGVHEEHRNWQKNSSENHFHIWDLVNQKARLELTGPNQG